MISVIVMKESAGKDVVGELAKRLDTRGFSVSVCEKNGDGRYRLAISHDGKGFNESSVEALPGVERCEHGNDFYEEHRFHFRPAGTVFNWGF